MIESVLKYKGFQVARYEAGLDENNNIVFKDVHITENKVTTTDAMMNWMAKNRNTVRNAESSKRNSGTVTGSEPKDVINNVYDLYGCHREWTLEAYDIYDRIRRGGLSGNDYAPSARDNNSPNNANYSNSSRAALYVY